MYKMSFIRIMFFLCNNYREKFYISDINFGSYVYVLLLVNNVSKLYTIKRVTDS